MVKARGDGIKCAIRPEQIRAARGLLDWTREKLSEKSGVPMRTLARLEIGEGEARPQTLSAVQEALEIAGVKFIKINGGGLGVRLRRRRL